MTPFQRLRLWARRAPRSERASVAVGAALALAAICWLVVPSTSRSVATSDSNVGAAANQSGSAGGGLPGPGGSSPGVAGSAGGGSSGSAGVANPGLSATGAPGGTGSGGAGSGGIGTAAAESGSGGTAGGAGASGAGGSTKQGPGAGTPTGSVPGTGAAKGGCVSPPGSEQGATADQIKLGFVLVNVEGPTANAALGLPAASDQQDAYQTMVDHLNASGGVACRKVVPEYFPTNPADQADLQQKCLDIVQAGVFAVDDIGSYTGFPALVNCFPQHKVPIFEDSFLPNSQMSADYPYLFADESDDVAYRNTIFALSQRGFFSPSNGFRKLGYLYRDCVPELPGAFKGWLGQVGVPAAEIVSYDFGCPSTFASPSDLEQAVLTFEQDGVTNVTEMDTAGDFSNFTTIAQQQGFHPRYGIPDDNIVSTSYGPQHPDYTNIANALAISDIGYGEERTPGFVPSPATTTCNAIMTAHGRPSVYHDQIGMGGIACDDLWLMSAAISHAPVLQRTALVAGLQATRSIDFSFPRGPASYTGQHVTYGGEFWRPVQFFTSCDCWQVTDPTFRPAFP